MRTYQLFCLWLLVVSSGCNQPEKSVRVLSNDLSAGADNLTNSAYDEKAGKGALLLTRFKSLAEFKEVIAIQYSTDLIDSSGRGSVDVAFYDLAETMVGQISDDDWLNMSCEDISEKGYLNTFNHITAQAFMTSIFSERLADFIADVHELYNMPALINGNFTEEQLADFENGPVDNYLDMINNEWGQELGKVLGEKYGIDRHTVWTPQLLKDYLNDIQQYHSWAFQIGFRPFRTTDNVVIQFAAKINTVLSAG